MIWNIAVLILSMFVCNMLFKLYQHFRRPKTIQKVRTLLGLKPKIIRFYKHSVKIACNKCGNHQTCGTNSRCHRLGFCSRCLQNKWLSGHLAYWG
jgi:hypothetical protein